MSDKLQFVVFLVSIRVETNGVNDKLKFVGLLLLRHAHFDAILFQLGDKDLSDCRIFILVFDQIAAFARARLAQTMRSSATTQRAHEPFAIAAPSRRDIARWIAAGVKVLMKPAIRRY